MIIHSLNCYKLSISYHKIPALIRLLYVHASVKMSLILVVLRNHVMMNFLIQRDLKFNLLTGDRRQTKQFCFLDADCLVVGESQSSSRCSAGKYPVKPPHPEGDSQTIDTYPCRNT